MTITEFLLARIAEDESAARAADGVTDKHEDDWQDVTQPITVCRTLKDEQWATKYGFAYPHISRHDPERVLAACEAKRRIIALHAELATSDTEYSGWVDLARDTLLALASEYADHPDYREEWRA